MDPLIDEIIAHGGVVLRKEALAQGYHSRAIAKLVDEGTWHRVRRGAYVSGEVWRRATRAERYRLYVLATVRQSKTDVVPSHVSAVVMHGGPLWGLDLGHSHLTRRDARTGRKEAGVEQHRGVIEEGDVVEVGGLPVMSPTRTALEVTTVASTEASLCVVDDFLHRGLTTAEALDERFAAMESWPDTLATPIVLRLASGRRESVGETRFFCFCRRAQLPVPTPQVEVCDEAGHVIGRVDFAWPELGLFVEFDGREKYYRHRRDGESMEDFLLREKEREDRIREVTDWRCIRVTWDDLRNPERLAARIRRKLGVRAA